MRRGARHRLLPDRHLTRSDLHDAVIVGYGPTAETAANLLGQQGRRVAVLERDAAPYSKPRAVHFDAETLRVFQSFGMAEQIVAIARPNMGAEFVDSAGRRLTGLEVPDPHPESGPEGWAPSWFFYHPQLDATLREGVARFPNVDVRLEHSVEAIEQAGDHAVVVARDLRCDETLRLPARYVLGCDGAGSFCRNQAGIESRSLGFDQDWLVADVELRRDVELPRIPRQVCDPERIVTLIPNVRRHRRWEFQLKPGETRDEMERPERVWELLSPWLAPDDAELIRAVVYTFHGSTAGGWRDRRLFLLGDAAHQMPPFMGQGMGSGIRDAANLAWKLGLVLDGKAPDSLLDSYETERRPHAEDVVEWAVSCGRLIDAFAAHEGGMGPEPSDEEKRSAYGGNRNLLALRGGVLQADPPPGAPVGEIFPQTRRPGLRLDDFYGERFALFAKSKPAGSLSAESLAFLEMLDARLFEIADVDDELGALALGFSGFHAVVVRPDRYVFGVAAEAEALDPLVRELKQRLG